MLYRRDALVGIREKINLCDRWLNGGVSGGNFFIVVTDGLNISVEFNANKNGKVMNYMICFFIL